MCDTKLQKPKNWVGRPLFLVISYSKTKIGDILETTATGNEIVQECSVGYVVFLARFLPPAVSACMHLVPTVYRLYTFSTSLAHGI